MAGSQREREVEVEGKQSNHPLIGVGHRIGLRPMSFNFKSFVEFTWIALFKSKDTCHQLTPKRISALLAFYLLFPLVELVHWTGFLLDDILCSEYQSEEINQPVFIVGHPRSGTTFLHRLLAKDTHNFSTMRLWEAVLAPSIVQRQIVKALTWLDRRLGAPLKSRMAAWDKRLQVGSVMHKVALQEPEEDQFILLHIWSTLAIWTFSAISDQATPEIHFDTRMPPEDKKRIMGFYKRCIQRHLHAHRTDQGRPVRYLAKDPSASPKIDTVLRTFPDAKIIYMVRNPLEAIPSYVSLLNYTWRLFGATLGEYGSRDYVLRIARHWYRYPLERLESAPQDSYAIVRYDDLLQDLERTVTDIYDRFGLEASPAFDQLLREEATKARAYRSKHRYSLKRLRLSRRQIVEEFADIFERFDFDIHEGSDRRTINDSRRAVRSTRRARRLARLRQKWRLRRARSRWHRRRTRPRLVVRRSRRRSRGIL
jgi:hypothetical protein